MTVLLSEIVKIVIYLFVGLFLILIDERAAVNYFTVLPFHYILLDKTIKRGYYVFVALFLLLFMSIGINSVTFFLCADDYRRTGFNAIGNFGFSLAEYWDSYIYVLSFSLSLYYSMVMFEKLKHCRQNTYKILIGYFTRLNNYNKVYKKSNIYVVIISLISIILTIILYYNQIGIRGMSQTLLPFHLTGVLYYFREIGITSILLYLYIKSPNRGASAVVIMVYLFFLSFTSVSRMLVAFLAIPMVIESFFSNHRKRSVVIMLSYLILFTWMSSARNFLYESTVIKYSLIDLVKNSINAVSFDSIEIIIYLINGISGRLFGTQYVVLAAQYDVVSFFDLCSYYAGVDISEIVPNMMTFMYGIDVVPGMAFGVSIGYIGQMVLFSNGNIIFSVLQGVFVSLVFTVMETCLSIIVGLSRNDMKKLFAYGMASCGVFSFWLGLTMSIVYYVIMMIAILSLITIIKDLNYAKKMS